MADTYVQIGGENVKAYRNPDNTVSLAADIAYQEAVNGQLGGATAAARMPDIACRLVMFKAAAANTGKVYVGGSGVTAVTAGTVTNTTTGCELAAGDAAVIPIQNLNKLYYITGGTADVLTYVALR